MLRAVHPAPFYQYSAAIFNLFDFMLLSFPEITPSNNLACALVILADLALFRFILLMFIIAVSFCFPCLLQKLSQSKAEAYAKHGSRQDFLLLVSKPTPVNHERARMKS